MFIHLHWHSHYSLLEWYWTPQQIIDRVKTLWMNSIALTDIENLYWWIEFYEKCIENNIKPILGVELNFITNIKLLPSIKKDLPLYITILAKSYRWYKNLIKLISTAQIENFHAWKAFVDFLVLEKFNKDIIVFMWWPKSWIGNQITTNTPDKQLIEILWNFINIFWKNNFFLEIQPQDPDILPEYRKINQKIFELAKKLEIKLIVNNNFFYPNPEDKEVFWVLKAINENQIYDPQLHIPKWVYHITSEEEILKMLKKYNFLTPENLIQTNYEISQQINIEIPLWNILFPKYEVAPETKILYEKYKNTLVEKS